MPSSIKQSALRTIEMEAESVRELINSINENFELAVEAIAKCNGRVVISGVGKSAIIAQKIVATLNSTGTPSIFMHAADAIHGDLGIVQPGDVVIVVSKSGSSPEIRTLIPLIKNSGNTLVAMVGNTDSNLARQAHFTIDTTVKQEACPNNLAPTSSTTAQLVMGDALAVCLMELKGFSSDDFARVHRGGMLGKKLYLRISDIYTSNERPAVLLHQSLKEVIMEITKKRMGATAVIDERENLKGVITDGDLRRMLEKENLSKNIGAKDIMTIHPKTIDPDELAAQALDIMRKYEISQLLVTKEGKYLGMIHLHDLLKEGFM